MAGTWTGSATGRQTKVLILENAIAARPLVFAERNLGMCFAQLNIDLDKYLQVLSTMCFEESGGSFPGWSNPFPRKTQTLSALGQNDDDNDTYLSRVFARTMAKVSQGSLRTLAVSSTRLTVVITDSKVDGARKTPQSKKQCSRVRQACFTTDAPGPICGCRHLELLPFFQRSCQKEDIGDDPSIFHAYVNNYHEWRELLTSSGEDDAPKKHAVVLFSGRDDAHLQDVDLRPDKGARQLPGSREETFQASFEVGMRTPGPVPCSTRRGRREHQRRSQVVVVVCEANSLSDAPGGRGRRVPVQGVLFLVALLPRRRPDDENLEQLLLAGGATRLTGSNPVTHPDHEPPFDLQRKGSGGGGRTRRTRRARPRRAVRRRRRWHREP